MGTKNWTQEPSKLMEERGSIYQEISQMTLERREENPQYNQATQHIARFQPGDKVWLWMPQVDKPHIQRNEGPYVIVSRVGPKTYRIMDPKGNIKRHPVVHQDKLAPARHYDTGTNI
jgi:hypothetical protein